MTSTKIPDVKIKRAMSVWSCRGMPVMGDTQGADRCCLYLMPLTANIAGVTEKFIRTAVEEDHIEYTGARLRFVHYIGWVWLPDSKTGWDFPFISGAITDLTEQIASLADDIKETSATLPPEPAK